MLAEILMELRIGGDVRLVVAEEMELNLVVAGTRSRKCWSSSTPLWAEAGSNQTRKREETLLAKQHLSVYIKPALTDLKITRLARTESDER